MTPNCSRCNAKHPANQPYALAIYGHHCCDDCWQAWHDRCLEEEQFQERERGDLGALAYRALADLFFGDKKTK